MRPVREQQSNLVHMTDDDLDRLSEVSESDILDAKTWADESIRDAALKSMLNAKQKDNGETKGNDTGE